MTGAPVCALAAIAAAAACAAPPAPPDDGVTIPDVMDTRAMIGTWGWVHASVDRDVARREEEVWTFAPSAGDWTSLTGVYRRAVHFTAADGVPFTCNQRPHYTLASLVTVRAVAAPGGARVDEVAYETTPSPCDRGLRRLAAYHASIEDGALVLRWDGGLAHLRRIDAPAAAPPPIAAAPAGPWRWSATSWTKHGLVQHEDERWELTAGDDGALAGWYVRTVAVHDPAGAPIPCAGAPRYTFVDRYLVRGRALVDLSARSPEPATTPEDEARPGDWRLEEHAVTADEHPCLASARRALDSATFDAIGDALVLTWRGGRRQVLLRP